MRLFFANLKKYRGYLKSAPVSILKTEVANTYLNWLWWFLEPILFMLTYSFVAGFIFNQKIRFFPLFIFIGLNTWNFFERCVKRGVVMMRRYRDIVTKTYVPKYIFVLVQMALEAIKIAISYLVLIVMMIVCKTPVTWRIFECIPLFFVLATLSFAGCSIMLHCGVFVSDLEKTVNVLLRLIFYLTGVFYDIGANKKLTENHPLAQTLLMKLNPIACIMNGLRNCILYGDDPKKNVDWLWIGVWAAAGFLLSALGIRLIHRYEAGYAKIS